MSVAGAGIKVFGAARFFEAVAGLEIDPGYVSAARRLFSRAGLGVADLYETDALTFSTYGDFDVLYFFRPLRDDEKLRQLEARIVQQAKARTLLLAPYRGFEQRHRQLGCTRLARGLYITGLSRGATVELRRRAEHIGPAVLPPRDPLPGLWGPVLAVCHANGYDVWRPGRLEGV